jgi:MFS family permease
MTAPENTLRVGIVEPGPSFRGALASRDFSLLFVGQLAAGIGNGLMQLALPFLVLNLTGSAFQLGFAYFFQFLPLLLFGVIGGVFVDRWDRRTTLLIADTGRAAAFLSAGTIFYFDALTVEYIYAVIFIEATLANFFNPARTALMPNLVKPEHLRAANSLMEVSRQIGVLVAPLAGALLSALFGPENVMLVDGATFLLSGVTIFFISWRPPPREQKRSDNLAHAAQIFLAQTAEGIAVVARSRLLQVAVLLGCSLNLIIAPLQLLMPLFVREIKRSDESYFALLVAGLMAGSILGALLAPQFARRVGLGFLTIGAVFVLGLMMSIASWPPTLWPPVLAMGVAGAAIGSLNVAQTTMLQTATSDDERGRVSAAYFTATQGLRSIAFVLMGALAVAVDVRLLFLGFGLVVIGLAGLLYRLPEVRNHR